MAYDISRADPPGLYERGSLDFRIVKQDGTTWVQCRTCDAGGDARTDYKHTNLSAVQQAITKIVHTEGCALQKAVERVAERTR